MVKITNTPTELIRASGYRTSGFSVKTNASNPKAINTKKTNERKFRNAGRGSINLQIVVWKAGANAIEIVKPIPVPVNNRRVLLGAYRAEVLENKLTKEFNPSIANNSAKIEITRMICQDGTPVRLRSVTHW